MRLLRQPARALTAKLVRMLGGSLVEWEPSDRPGTDVSRDLTPVDVDRILSAANSGDTADQCRLAAEIEEKNWDIAQAVQTRRLAVAGCEWEILPPEGDDSPAAAKLAEECEAMLRNPQWDYADFDTFAEALFFELGGALMPGFAVVENIWSPGGAELLGFRAIEPRHFTFRDSRTPLLITADHSEGVPLEPPGKFTVHYHRARAGARCRGGLIRPLVWLHVFQQLNVKDLLTFIERYGMPFLIARVGDDAYQRDRNRLKYLIQNFGPAGGAVFSDAVQTELMQASNSTGDVYFRLLEYTRDAATKVVLGQTASSSEGGGLSADNEQGKVRQDILESDARALERTARAGIIRPWVVFSRGPGAPIPRLHIKCETPEDLVQRAATLQNLYAAGLEADPAEQSDAFGMTLTRSANPALPSPAGPDAPDDARALSDISPVDAGLDTAERALAEFLGGQGLREWLGPLQAAIDHAASATDDAEFLERVQALTADLPGLYDRMDTTAWEDILSRVIWTELAAGKAARAEELAAKE